MPRDCWPTVWMPRPFIVIAVLDLVPSGAAAGSPPPTSRPEPPQPQALSATPMHIAWADVVRLLQAHPSTAAGRLRMAAARAAAEAAGAIEDPSLEASLAHGRARDIDASRLEWELALSVPLGWIATRATAVDAATAEADVTDAAVEAASREILLGLRILFWRLLYEQERVATLEALARHATRLLASVKQSVATGDRRAIAVLHVEIEQQQLAGELEVARLVQQARRHQLATSIGVEPAKISRAVGDLGALPEPMSSSTALETMRSRHPALLAANARVRAAAARVGLEHRSLLPEISVQPFSAHELDRSAHGVGLRMSLPFWAWSSARIRQAQDELAAERKQLEAEILRIETATLEIQSTCEAGLTFAARYREAIVPRAEAAAATTERTYELGEARLLDVIDARRKLLETRKDHLAVLLEAQIACSRLHIFVEGSLP